MDVNVMLDFAIDTAAFDHAGELNVGAIEFLPEVRKMCEDQRCRAYGHKWTCPPACGSLEEITEKAKAYSKGIIVQSTGQMEDDFDYETMMDTEAVHKKRFEILVHHLREEIELDCLPMSAGTCTVCKDCTYPDQPCRFPKRAIPSMEAYGIFVSKICEDSGIKYNYGRQTITYTSCVLFN